MPASQAELLDQLSAEIRMRRHTSIESGASSISPLSAIRKTGVRRKGTSSRYI